MLTNSEILARLTNVLKTEEQLAVSEQAAESAEQGAANQRRARQILESIPMKTQEAIERQKRRINRPASDVLSVMIMDGEYEPIEVESWAGENSAPDACQLRGVAAIVYAECQEMWLEPCLRSVAADKIGRGNVLCISISVPFKLAAS